MAEENTENQINEVEETNSDINTESTQTETNPTNDVSDNQNSDEKPKKQKSLISKILIGIIAFLLFVIIVGIVLYITGFFDPEPVKEEVTEIQKEQPVEEKYKFDLSTINSKKLNAQLASLTNKNLNQEQLEEKERLENEKKLVEEKKRKEQEALKEKEEALLKEKEELEAKKLELENQKLELEKLKQEAITKKEEMITTKTQLETNPEIVIDTPIEEEKPKSNSFLKMINVAKIKGELYKEYLDTVTAINSNVILCRDDKNRIEIYFGPFESNEQRDELLNKLLKNKFDQSYSLELTTQEFDKRCNY